MKLIELSPRWIGAGGDGITRDGVPVPRREGVALWLERCPCGCGTPLCLYVDPPLDGGAPIGLPAWRRTGDTFETLTLAPSILRNSSRGGCGWHGFIRNGEIVRA